MAKGKDWKVTERVGMVSWFGGNQGSRVVENWRLTKNVQQMDLYVWSLKLKPHVIFSMYFHFLPIFICTQKLEKMITAPDKGSYSIFSLEPNLDLNNYRRRYCGMEMTHPSPIAAK